MGVSMTLDLILFLLLALISVVSAISMVVSRNTVYSALFLVLNFGTIALFFLLLGGPFIAMTQITVYAGAIMVLFLFVIMLLGVQQVPAAESTAWQRPLAIGFGLLLLAEAAYILFFRGTTALAGQSVPAPEGFGGPRVLADVLFNQYGLPVIVIGVLLLVAMVGVIVMVKNVKERQA
jgi:NADH-quinone oxidoreductase subunit J